jgi:hypothetical protein
MSRSTLAQLAAFPLDGAFPLDSRLISVRDPRPLNSIGWTLVTAGGSGYGAKGSTFPVTYAGSTATGVAIVGDAGAVVAVRQTSGGGVHASDPAAIFSAGPGTGAAGTGIRWNPLADMAAMQATHLAWHYATDPSFVAQVLAAGIAVQATLSGMVFDSHLYPDACCTSMDGQRVPVGWLQGLGRSFGASYRPAYFTYQQDRIAPLLAMGVVGLQFDDPTSDISALHSLTGIGTGGSFDASTQAGFRGGTWQAELVAAGVTQQTYNWATQTFTGPAGNWSARYSSANPADFPARGEFIDHLWAGVMAFQRRMHASLGQRAYTVNAYDQGPRESSMGLLVGVGTGSMTETDTDRYSGAAPVAFGERMTKLWVNARTPQGAGKGCALQLQALRNDMTYTSTRQARLALMRKQAALTYALGALPLYPFDVYLYPFNDAPGATVQNERFFAQQGDGFLPIYGLVARYGELFRDLNARHALLLACDVSIDGVSQATVQQWADTALRQGVPVGIYPMGPGIPRMPEVEAAALRLINCTPGSPHTDALSGPNVTTLAGTPISVWGRWTAATVSGGTDVFALPRYSPRRMVTHVLNFDAAPAALTLTLSRWAVPRRGALWCVEPGQRPRRLTSRRTAAGFSVQLGTVTDWMLVVQDLA